MKKPILCSNTNYPREDDMSYTVEQVAVLTKAAEAGPINWDRAKEIGNEIGQSPRSVVAKVMSMELPYEAKPAEPKRPKGLTKNDLVLSIKARLNAPDVDLKGLEKATAQALNKLLEAIPTS